MAKLGDFYFDVLLNDRTKESVDKIKKQLQSQNVRMGVNFDFDVSGAVNDISNKLRKKTAKGLNVKFGSVILGEAAKDQIQKSLDKRTFTLKNVNLANIDTSKIEQKIEDAVKRGLQRGSSGNGNGGGNSGGNSVLSAFEKQKKEAFAFLGGMGKGMLALFGLNSIETVIKRMADTIGTFEQQCVALKSILQSTERGNTIFNQIKEFSVKSPFTFAELTDYAKQLTAFQIPYNELFDTTKRLADLSAGLGVDMNRIILAYGQVRSAAFLRGQELRQFTEAGIPMVQALADKFSELEGRVVSTGEVFTRISNREVSFEMVKEIINDLTNEGGKFYQMQEKQAETLKGKISNLSDAYDVMLYNLGQHGVGTMLKFFVSLAGSIMECTNAVGALIVAMAFGGAAFGILKLISYYRVFATVVKQSIVQLKTFMKTKALADLSSGVVGWISLAVTAISGLVYAMMNADAKFDERKKNMIDSAKELEKTFVDMGNNIGSALEKTDDEAGRSLKASVEKIKSELSEGLGVAIEVAINKGGDTDKERLRTAKEYADELANIARIAERMSSTDYKNRSWIEFWDENIETDVNDYLDYVEKFNKLWEQANERAYLNGGKQESYSEFLGHNRRRFGNAYKSSIAEAEKEIDAFADKFEAAFMARAKDLGIEVSALGAEARSALIEKYMTAQDVGEAQKFLVSAKLDLRLNANEDDLVKKSSAMMSEFYKYLDAEAGKHGVKLRELFEKANYGEKAALDKLSELYTAAGIECRAQNELISNEYDRLMIYLRNNPLHINILTHYNAGNAEGSVYQNRAADAYIKSEGLNPTYTNALAQFKLDLPTAFAVLSDISDPSNAQKALQKTWREAKENLRLGQMEKNNPDVDKYRKQVEQLEKAAELLGLPLTEKSTSGSGKSKSDEWLKQRKSELSLLDKYISTYEKLVVVYGKAEALRKLDKLTEFSKLRDANGNFRYGSPADAVDAYKKFGDTWRSAANNPERKEFIEGVDIKAENKSTEEEQKKIKDATEKAKKSIDELTKKWEKYQKVLNATENARLAARMAFGTDTMPFSSQTEQLQDEIRKELANNPDTANLVLEQLKGKDAEELSGLNIGQALAKKITEYFSLVAKEDEKAQTAILKVLESAKGHEERMQAIERDYEEAVESVNRMGLSSTESANLIGNLQKQRDEKKSKEMWENFTKGGEYTHIFDDFDRVSTKSLENLYESLKDLEPEIDKDESSLKAWTNALKKLHDEIEQRSPFKTLSSQWRVLSTLGSLRTKNGLTDPLTAEQASVLGLKEGQRLTDEELSNLRNDALKSFSNGINGVSNAFDALNKVLEPVCTLFEQLGEESLSDITNGISSAMGAASNSFQGMSTLSEIAENAGNSGLASALGTAAPYVAAASAGVSVLTTIFALHDKAIEKEIEASEQRQKEWENFTKNLESLLERSLAGVYGLTAPQDMVDTLLEKMKSDDWYRALGARGNLSSTTRERIEHAQSEDWNYYDTAYASLLAQRDEAQRQYELEQSKKKKDSGAIEDAKQEIAELDEQISEFAATMAEELYGIDFKSWASDLAQSLVDAWASGADAAKAYKDSVNDILKDVAQSVIQQSIIGKMIEPIKEQFQKQFEADNGEITDASAGILATLFSTAEEAASKSSSFLDKFNQIAKENGSAGLKDSEASSLSSNIQNVTEETADLLVSYVNAIRADVSYKRQTLSEIGDVIGTELSGMNEIANGQLAQLRMIATFTERNAMAAESIKTALNNVIYVSSSGYRVRV